MRKAAPFYFKSLLYFEYLIAHVICNLLFSAYGAGKRYFGILFFQYTDLSVPWGPPQVQSHLGETLYHVSVLCQGHKHNCSGTYRACCETRTPDTFIHFSQHRSEVDTVIISILWMRKLTHREGRWLTHTQLGKYWS